MPTYPIKSKKTGKTYQMPWDGPAAPTGADVRKFIFEQDKPPVEPPEPSMWDKLNTPIVDVSPDMKKHMGEFKAEHPVFGTIGELATGAVTSSTTPLSIGLGGLGAAGAIGTKIPAIARGSRTFLRGAGYGMGAHGAYNVEEGVRTGDYGRAIAGGMEGLGGLAGVYTAGHGMPELNLGKKKPGWAGNVPAGHVETIDRTGRVAGPNPQSPYPQRQLGTRPGQLALPPAPLYQGSEGISYNMRSAGGDVLNLGMLDPVKPPVAPIPDITPGPVTPGPMFGPQNKPRGYRMPGSKPPGGFTGKPTEPGPMFGPQPNPDTPTVLGEVGPMFGPANQVAPKPKAPVKAKVPKPPPPVIEKPAPLAPNKGKSRVLNKMANSDLAQLAELGDEGAAAELALRNETKTFVGKTKAKSSSMDSSGSIVGNGPILGDVGPEVLPTNKPQAGHHPGDLADMNLDRSRFDDVDTPTTNYQEPQRGLATRRGLVTRNPVHTPEVLDPKDYATMGDTESPTWGNLKNVSKDLDLPDRELTRANWGNLSKDEIRRSIELNSIMNGPLEDITPAMHDEYVSLSNRRPGPKQPDQYLLKQQSERTRLANVARNRGRFNNQRQIGGETVTGEGLTPELVSGGAPEAVGPISPKPGQRLSFGSMLRDETGAVGDVAGARKWRAEMKVRNEKIAANKKIAADRKFEQDSFDKGMESYGPKPTTHQDFLQSMKDTIKLRTEKLKNDEGGFINVKDIHDVVKHYVTKENAIEVAGIPRSLQSSFDVSAPFRQGAFMVSRPQFWKNLKPMFKALGSEEAHQAINAEIQSRPSFPLMEESKLAVKDFNLKTGREEQFISNLAEKIPGIGKVVRASDRAYTTFLKKTRADVFDSMMTDYSKMVEKSGIEPNPHIAEEAANYINAATGRGNLGALESSAEALNTMLFSPRLIASRLKLMNPQTYLSKSIDPFIRKQAARDLFGFTGSALAVIGLAKAGGADVEINPTSSDFGKIRMGNTRIDMFAGFQPYVRLAAQISPHIQLTKKIALGEYTSTTTGKSSVVGKGNAPTRLDLAVTGTDRPGFLESKFAPIPALAFEIMRGKDFNGQPLNVPEAVLKRVVPIFLQDVYEIYNNDPKMLPATPLSALGMNVQSYAKKKPRRRQQRTARTPR